MAITIDVEGMTCQHCVANVKKSLEALAGVEEAIPDLDSGKVIINGEQIDDKQIKQAVTDAGYQVKE